MPGLPPPPAPGRIPGRWTPRRMPGAPPPPCGRPPGGWAGGCGGRRRFAGPRSAGPAPSTRRWCRAWSPEPPASNRRRRPTCRWRRCWPGRRRPRAGCSRSTPPRRWRSPRGWRRLPTGSPAPRRPPPGSPWTRARWPGHPSWNGEPRSTQRGRCASLPRSGPLRVGIGGPVGSGKTALVAALCRLLSGRYEVAVITNDIYTTEDAEALLRMGVMPPERVRAVETGCCPHTAIRDDVAANLEAVDDLSNQFPELDLLLIESGGDNLTATFSPALADVQIFVIDVAGGDKVPRKGGPGVSRSDLLVINKTDLAPLVGADLGVMARDAARQRGDRATLFTSLVGDAGAAPVAEFLAARL